MPATESSEALTVAARAAFATRAPAGRELRDAARDIARACHDMAVRFRQGGTLLTFGAGGPSTDAQHVAVEFVHPVIVGKRALPALSLGADAATVMGVARRSGLDEVFAHQISVLARAEDIALGISSDGEDVNVLRGLEQAHRSGLLTVALVGAGGGAIAVSPAVDHRIVVRAEHPHIVKELHVTAYHLLWELVHVFLEQPRLLEEHPATLPAADGRGEELGALYPFLYEGDTGIGALLDEVAGSCEAKSEEIVTLRDSVGRTDAEALARCGAELAGCFERGGKLLAFGNGGSSSDAQEVVQSFLDPDDDRTKPLPALCLTNDVAVLTALSNDVDFEVVFARQVRAFGRPGDAVLGLSTSGNSPNLLEGFAAAKALGLLTIGMAGGDGGAMAASEHLDHLFVVPSSSVHRIQESQTTLYHVLRELVGHALDGSAQS